ncbi:MAG: HepT-like ribonuclease domain-containing protein [Deltaproteobacteria bacterium]
MSGRIVHDYFGIDYEIVWNIIEQTLPIFERQIRSIINET